MVAGGHHGASVVFLMTSSKDKSQILNVTAKAVKFPSKVADYVVNKLTDKLGTLPKGKVKDFSNEFMTEFRELASTLRDQAIEEGIGGDE